MKKSFLLLLALAGGTAMFADGVTIIPKPQQVEVGTGEFSFGRKIVIRVNDKDALLPASSLSSVLEQSTSKKITVKVGEPEEGAINFILKPSATFPKDGYQLRVTKEGVWIEAANEAGLFYGAQSLRQLLPATIESETPVKANKNLSIPVVTIDDAPRFQWRGYMQDVSRTFYSVDVLKKYIDVMSLYKMNVLHLHLTDDQGWRLEIKKYPKLTSKQTTEFPAQYNQPAERSGFYTQEQIKDLIAYAQERHVMIVPEIDIPGHSWPTLIAYPHLGVNDRLSPNHVFPFIDSWGHWGNQFTPNTLDPTSEAVYDFINDVMKEVADLFPAPYIHFGGDEVMHKFWDDAPQVVKFMKDKGFASHKELQSYFVERVTDIVTAYDKLPIGWNDILVDKNLTRKSGIMCWLGENGIVEATKRGHYAVASPTYPFYFDITQADRNDGTMCDLNYGFINSLEAGYNYNPMEGVAPENAKFVLGVQANMWPAVPQEVKDINVQNFPRMFAVAEVGWSSEKGKDFEEFSDRVEVQKERLDELKVDYYRPNGYVVEDWAPADISQQYQTIEWEVTPKVYASGRVIAGFYMTKGEHELNIQEVELLENGKVISTDSHESTAKVKKNIFRPYNYNLEVKDYNPKAKYTLRAKVKGNGGTDSYGNVTFNLSPYKPFTVVEPKNK